MKFYTDEVTWYEDGNMIEYWTTEDYPQDRICKECSLKDAIAFAQEKKLCLYIQTAEQDAGLFVDYTE